MRCSILLIIACALGATSCKRHAERVTLLEASHLRHVIIKPTNEHVVKLDIIMPKDEWDILREKDTILKYQDCPNKRKNTPSYFNYGIPQRESAESLNGQSVYRVTFDMFSTNIPAEISGAMKDILCVELFASAGYGWTSYYSDRVSVRR